MNLFRVARPFLAARSSRQAAPLREKVTYYNKAEKELVMAPSTTIACYTFSAIFSCVCLYLAYRFIVKANERDIRREEFVERTYKSELKPRPWPPTS